MLGRSGLDPLTTCPIRAGGATGLEHYERVRRHTPAGSNQWHRVRDQHALHRYVARNADRTPFDPTSDASPIREPLGVRPTAAGRSDR